MLSGHCFKQDCRSKIFAQCDCDENIFVCQDHAVEHVTKPSYKRHQLFELYFRPAEEIKQPIILKLTELRKEIKNFKKQVIKDASEVIIYFENALENYIKQIYEIDEKCCKIIEFLHNNEQFIDILNDNDIESVLKLNAQNVMLKINAWSTNWYQLDYTDIITAINKIYEIPFNPLNPFKEAGKEEIELNELSFFNQNTSDFSTINLEFEVFYTKTLPIEEDIDAYVAKCILPNKIYFYCCNPRSLSGITFIIEKNQNVARLQNSKINRYLSPVFYNGFIYMIGGYYKLAERYNFRQNLWESVARLPQNFNFDHSYSILFGDLVLITGYYIHIIIIYSLLQNDYEEVPGLVLYHKCSKLMMKGNNRVYLIEKGQRIFESEENSILIWNYLGNNDMPDTFQNQSVVVRYKGCLYSVQYQNKLWKFDLSSKKLSEVKTLNIC